MEAGVAQRPLSRLAQAWSELTTLLWNLLSEATEILDWFLRKRGPPPRTFYQTMYKVDKWTGSGPPWDIGAVQPCVETAYREGHIYGSVLDLGCGQGDIAIYLAAQGLKVLAVDNSMDALDMAQRRLDAAGGQVPMNLQLRWADTVHLSRTLGRRHFDTLLDCAMLHCLRSRQQKTYLDSLTTQVSKGSRLVLFAFSDANKEPWKGPGRLSEAQLRTMFSAKTGWRVDSISPELYEVAPDPKIGILERQLKCHRLLATRL